VFCCFGEGVVYFGVGFGCEDVEVELCELDCLGVLVGVDV